MNFWNKLDKQITESPRYKFFKKHERLLIFVQGLIIIGLLCGIIMFFIQDLGIKEQIRDNCGYTTDTYECICDKNVVDGWKEFKENNNISLNLVITDDV